jgi:hypothetical protein
VQVAYERIARFIRSGRDQVRRRKVAASAVKLSEMQFPMQLPVRARRERERKQKAAWEIIRLFDPDLDCDDRGDLHPHEIFLIITRARAAFRIASPFALHLLFRIHESSGGC